MTNMDNIIVIESEDSDNSIIEVEVPKKPTPPLIFIEDEEMVLNIKEKNQESLLAKDFISQDKALSSMRKTVSSSKSPYSPNHWTVDMIKYYDDDWGDEDDFIVEKLQKKMDKHPSLWKMSEKDRLKTPRDFSKNRINCWNCGQRGHYFSDCPDPPFVPKCHMCGIEGHAEYLCPNSICLNCGNHSRGYVTCCSKCANQMHEICSRCQLIGHSFTNCPDHWRLFHMTTGTTSVKIPTENIHKAAKDLWCCNCGRRGHNQVWCPKRKDSSGFMDSSPFVISYERNLNYSQPYKSLKPYELSNNTERGGEVQERLADWLKGSINCHMCLCSNCKATFGVKEKICLPNVLESRDISKKKSKKTRRRGKKAKERERILKINQQNKPIRKDTVDLINIGRSTKKNKKTKNKKKLKQRFFDGLLI